MPVVGGRSRRGPVGRDGRRSRYLRAPVSPVTAHRPALPVARVARGTLVMEEFRSDSRDCAAGRRGTTWRVGVRPPLLGRCGLVVVRRRSRPRQPRTCRADAVPRLD
ncbi:hypothetical protein BN12_3130002 [Nostocoides japonicum T1-X7]|uniref:Uncharacterized protein n=1 Tax=Nostocoides japonicum T1-X7 TaxID=1194083 RepID=A0A077M0M4_9MICO|nr:hypothetical protein BN12_3130002 [Tetrasphaera japonica T1-X7]